MGKIVKDKNANVNNPELVNGISNHNYKGEYDRVRSSITQDQDMLLKVFEIFNDEFFNNELDIPVILIETNMRKIYSIKKPEGWVKYDRHHIDQNKERMKESELITMSFSKELFALNTKEIYITLLRAMVEQWDVEKQASIPEWRRLINNNGHFFSSSYYNECAKRGLVVDEESLGDVELKTKTALLQSGKCKMIGDTIFNSVYERYGIEEHFKLLYKYDEEEKKDKTKDNKTKKSKQSMRKYVCSKCKMSIRVTKSGEIDIRCYNGECNGVRFVEANEGK